MDYASYRAEKNKITTQALKRFAEGDKRALLVGKQRLIGLEDHRKGTRSRRLAAGLALA